MADLMISSSPSPVLITMTPTVPTSTGGGGAGLVVDSQNVTGGSPKSSLLSSPPSLSNRTTVIPHPQNSSSNNGQKMNCTEDDNSSSHNYNNNAHHRHHQLLHHSPSNNSSTVSSSTSSSPTKGGLLQHHRNHSHPLVFSSSANNNSNDHVDSSSSVAPEMATANNGDRATVVNQSVVQALPSSSTTTATTMDILNLDFVNGNSSYCHNSNNAGRGTGTTSSLSHWSPQTNAKPNADLIANTNSACGDHHPRDLRSVSLNLNNNCSTGGDLKASIAKIPGEIPESVMKYLLTKTDSVDSTKSSDSNSPSSSSHLSSPISVVVPMSFSAPSSSEHHHHTNKRLQEFLVDLDTLQSTSEIAKVLENFNAILEKIEQEDDKEALEGLEALATPLSPSVLQCPTATVSSTNKIKNSVETLAELLLSGCGDEEDEDLLIIIDENDSESLQAGASLQNIGSTSGNNGVDVSVFIEDDSHNCNNNADEDDEEVDDVSSLVEIEADLGDLDHEEGYESDRPIVRASMRKLRPVKLLPMPSSSTSSHHHIHSSNGNRTFSTPPPTPVTPRANSPVDSNVGLASCLNSPIANNIIVASLINNLNSSSPQNSPSNSNSQRNSAEGLLTVPGQTSVTPAVASCSSSVIHSNFVPTLEVLHVSSGANGAGSSGSGNNSHSQGHSRNQSNSSQIQFHQNPVTITPNPVGFVGVNIGNSSGMNNNANPSGSGTSGVHQPARNLSEAGSSTT